MTYDQYWNDDCCLVKYYRKAYELQKDRKNQELWLQGMYIYEAIGDMSPILRPFTKKGTKPVEYVSEPYAISKKEVHDREVQREKAAYDKMKAKANAFAIRFNGELSKKPREESVSDGK